MATISKFEICLIVIFSNFFAYNLGWFASDQYQTNDIYITEPIFPKGYKGDLWVWNNTTHALAISCGEKGYDVEARHETIISNVQAFCDAPPPPQKKVFEKEIHD